MTRDRQGAGALLDAYGLSRHILPPEQPTEVEYWSIALRPSSALNAYLTAMGWLRGEGWEMSHIEAASTTQRGETVPTVVVIHVLVKETNP